MSDVQPVRLQLSRRKGFDLQAHSRATNGLPAVNVARPHRWSNPWRVQDWGREKALSLFRGWFGERADLKAAILKELQGKNLACWCAHGAPCHADVLLELANPSDSDNRTKVAGC